MRFSLTLIVVPTLLLMSGCDLDTNIKKSINKYYAIDSVLDAQLQLFNEKTPALYKTAMVEAVQEDTTLTDLDSAGWAKELSVLNNISINKPALRDKYTVKEIKTDSGRWIRYDALPEMKEELEVEHLHILFSENQKLKQINALYKEFSTLYDAKRTIVLVFDPETGHLKNYSIEGFQKMILQDTTRYQVYRSILY